jgi:PTS system mannitol-specific IIC component
MGSSVMGASILRRKLQEAQIQVDVRHAAVSELPASARMVISHQGLTSRVKEIAPEARIYAVEEFIQTPVYDEVVQALSHVPMKS